MSSSIVDALTGHGVIAILAVVLLLFIIGQLSLDSEDKRRLHHFLTGHLLVLLSYVIPEYLALYILLIAAAVIHILQTYYPAEFRRYFGPILRKLEANGVQLPGAFYFLLGAAAALIVSDNIDTARYAVECLAVADPMASWIGTSVSSARVNENSTVAGCAACFASAYVVGYFMLAGDPRTLAIGALACTIAEAVQYGNDNLNIPLVTALAVEKFA
eukprot:scaffold7344_cov145-Cylindrotheca_fusiformis.AAC.21